MTGVQVALIAAVTLPALLVVLWPIARGRGADGDVPGVAPDDRRLELLDEKAGAYRALKELAFDRDAGHLSEDDYQALRDRYELQAAAVLSELDALPPVATSEEATTGRRPADAATRGWTRHPATFAVGAVVLVVFGVVLGLNAGRFTEPNEPVGRTGVGIPGPGSPPMASGMPPVAGIEPGKPIPPEMLAGMLRAARQSLQAGRYAEAIAAYQAVLKRDPKNVDAMTHLGLIVALGGHADAALETFDKAVAIDATYAPAYLYRGRVLYDAKQDYAGALAAWERFLVLVPAGEDHDRVVAMASEARAKRSTR